MRKHLLFLLLCCTGLLRGYAFTVDGLSYSVADGVATLTGGSNTNIQKLTIPATVTYGGSVYPVNYIAGQAFWNYSQLTELVIEDSEECICSPSYVDSKGVTHPGSPFENCPLTKVYVGRDLAKRYGSTSFRTDVTPIVSTADHLDLTIAGKATYVMPGLESSITEEMTFRDKAYITTVTIGGNVEEMCKGAFLNCTGLRKVTFLPGDTKFQIPYDNVFQGCTIDSLMVSREISGKIYGGGTVRNLIFTPELTHVDADAFTYCSYPFNLVIQDGDTPLDTDAAYSQPFNSCSIESLYIGREQTNNAMYQRAGIKNVTFGPKITEINQNYVYNHAELEQVTFLGNVKKIDNYAFYGTGITVISLPESLTEIANSAFQDCSKLAAVSLPSKIENIQAYAFYNTAISEITLPASLKSVENNAFSNCNALKKVVIADADEVLDSNSDGYGGIFPGCSIDSLYIGRPHTNPAIYQRAGIKNVTFGPKITEINQNYVYNHAELEQVTFLGNVKKIDTYAFFNTGISHITLPESLTEIANSAFQDCSKLTAVTLPAKIENIQANAFYNTAISEIALPASLKSVEGNAFSNCTALKKVVIADADEILDSNSDGYGGIFPGCSIDSLYIGRSLQSQVLGRAGITNVEFGSKVTELTSGILYNHQELQTITLPATLTHIGANEFAEDNALTLVYTQATEPPVCDNSNVFSATAYNSATLMVPVGTKKLYREAEVWKQFKNIVSDGPGFNVTLSYDTAMGEVLLNGEKVFSTTIEEDEALTVTISPAPDHELASVMVNGQNVTASLKDGKLDYESLDTNLDIQVEFRLITYALTLPTELQGGTIGVSGADDLGFIPAGTSISLSINPARGYYLSSFFINGSDMMDSLADNQPLDLTVSSDLVIEAQFSRIIYTVSASGTSTFGSVTVNGSANECKVEFESPVVIKVTPRDEGCFLEKLLVDGTDVTADIVDCTYTIESVETDMIVEASFGIYTYTIDYSYDSTLGHISSGLPGDNGETVVVEHGSAVELLITPVEGYEIAYITLDGKDVSWQLSENSVLTLEKVSANHHVEVGFDIKRVRLTVVGLEGGSVSLRYDYGTEITLYVEAEDGWEFNSLTAGDDMVTELDEDNSWTTSPLKENTLVSIVFKRSTQVGTYKASTRNISVKAYQRTITILGADNNETTEIYDTAGILIYRGCDHTINLDRSGVFIVSIDGQTFKVALR